MRVVSKAKGYEATKVQCPSCRSELEASRRDWRQGTYGDELVCKCPVCKREIVKPGTEYRGDF